MSDIDLVVATDDRRVADHAEANGCRAMLTAPAITSGSGRVLACAQAMPTPPQHVVNLQGDAPFYDPICIRQVVTTLQARPVDCVTPVIRLGWDDLDRMRAAKAVEPFSGTTCIAAEDGRAIWFSKAIIPAMRNEAALRAGGPLSPVLRHIGIYGYTMQALEAFERAPPTPYEECEGLEQLRMLGLGLSIQTVTVPVATISMSGIDTPADARLAEELIARWGDPHA